MPDQSQLAAYTETVYRNCPYSDKLLSAAPHPQKTAIPTKIGEPSPIKHVIYIIKENRTFDQVFGDIGRGNCDPSLVMFGQEVTPNHHKLANEFVLLDNLYCNGHVSADGHPWSTMATCSGHLRATCGTPVRGTTCRIAAMANMAAASVSPMARSGWKAACRVWWGT